MAELNLRTPNGYDGQPATQHKMGIVRLATDAEATAGTSNRVALTPSNGVLAIPNASTTVRGIVFLATDAEAVAGVNTTDAIVPSSLTARLAAPGAIGGTTPGAGAFTTLTSTGITTLGSGAGVASKLGNTTGTLGFFGSTGATRVTQGAITNSVTAGGVTGTIADYTDLSVYANDSAAIRNDIYQLSLALANVVGALRSYGLLA